MYSLLKNTSWKEVLRDEVLPLFVSAMIAELFFKFHSFTLECVSFLMLWYVVGAAYTSLLARFATERGR